MHSSEKTNPPPPRHDKQPVQPPWPNSSHLQFTPRAIATARQHAQHCATDEEASIQSGIEMVKSILAKHFVHRNESKLIKSTIKEKGRHKVIDKVTVELNDKDAIYEATFTNLGLKHV